SKGPGPDSRRCSVHASAGAGREAAACRTIAVHSTSFRTQPDEVPRSALGAVKIVRQPNKIALLGAPTSAAAMSAGHEGARAALRAACLIDRLRAAGYEVADLGDDPVQLHKPDEESPRARNLRGVLGSIEALKPRVEAAIKSSALPLIISGDCSVALATVAGARRYFRSVSFVYVDRDADL